MNKKVKLLGFVALTIAMFMGMLDSTIVNIALPDIGNCFHENLSDISWVSTVYVMGLAVLSITASKLADQYGRKKFMIIGLIIFGGSSALCGLSNSLAALIVCRILQSVGGSIITPLVIPMGLELFGKENLQKVASAVGAVSALAAAGGPPIGGVLIKYINWESIFFVNVPLAFISLVLTIFFVGESYDNSISKKIDWLGTFLLTAALFQFTFALLKGNDYGWTSTLIISLFIGSIVATALFIFTELKVKEPMLELHLFRESTFAMSVVCNVVTFFGMACPILIFSYFLQDAVGYDALKAALIIMGVALTVTVSMPIGTAIASKFGANPVNFFGLLCLSGGIFMLSRVRVNTSQPTMIAFMIVCGIGLGFACQAIISAVKHIPVEKSGIASGVVNSARYIGISLGIAILVSFLDSNITTSIGNIRTDAISSAQKSSIVSSVKTVMIKDIKDNLPANGNTSNLKESNLQSKLQNDIQNSASSITSAPRPKDGTLAKVYDATSSIKSGTSKAADGQKSLNSGIISLDSGLSGLYGGSQSLLSGTKSLDNGVSQIIIGSEQLSAGTQKINSLNPNLTSLSNGTGGLLEGLNKLFNQFYKTTGGNTTLKDKIDSLNTGAKKVYFGTSDVAAGAKQVSDGTAALAAQFGTSPGTIGSQISSLNSGAKSYVGTSNAIMSSLRGNSSVYTSIYNSLAAALSTTPKDTAGISNLTTTLILITNTNNSAQLAQTIGILKMMGISADQSYITAQQTGYDNGGTALTSAVGALEAQTKPGTAGTSTLYDKITSLNSGAQSVTSGAQALESGASQVADGINTFDQQTVSGKSSGSQTLYDDISALNSGAAQIASGTSQLASGTSRLGELQSGFNGLMTALNKLKTGSSQLVVGSQDLQCGLSSAKSGSSHLVGGSTQLTGAFNQISDGASQLTNGVGLAGQQKEIENTVNDIKSDKNNEIADAFDKTFFFAAVILAAASSLGLFTDKRTKNKMN